jgi:uncharacterized protein YukE
MAESDIHANPQRIRSLAEELSTFTSNLRSAMEKMNSELQRLGTTWQDEEYRKFKLTFDRLNQDFEKLGQEIKKRQPELEEDAEVLCAYLAKSQ